MDLKPVITTAGLAAIFNATSTGVEGEITHIALGDAAYAPTQDATALRSERARYPVAGGSRVSPRQIHVTSIAEGDGDFWVREIGFLLGDGTLLAVWSSDAAPLAYKAPGVELILAYDLLLDALPPDSVTVALSPLGLSLFMAGELAALTAASIDGMTRQILQKFQLVGVAADVADLSGEGARTRKGLSDQIGRQQQNHRDALAIGVSATLAHLVGMTDRIRDASILEKLAADVTELSGEGARTRKGLSDLVGAHHAAQRDALQLTIVSITASLTTQCLIISQL